MAKSCRPSEQEWVEVTHLLVGLAKHVLQRASVSLVKACEESVAYSSLSPTTRATNTMYVVLDRQREGVIDHDLRRVTDSFIL